MPCELLRDKILDGSLTHEDMSETDYEYLLKKEMESGKPNKVVSQFCVDGLKRFDKYKEWSDGEIVGLIVFPKVGETTKTERFFKQFSVATIAVLTFLVIATYTAGAFGYNIVDIIRRGLTIPDKTITDIDGKDLVRSDNFREYNSMLEMLNAENLNIFYPVKLPFRYSFANFEVRDFGTHIEVLADNSEPYISYKAEVGTSQIPPDSYLYEINGIKYNIIEFENGIYQACWFSDDGNDYYTIATDNQAVISEIIENLKES